MIMQLKHFHDILNTAVILVRGREVVFTKCTQFTLTFTG